MADKSDASNPTATTSDSPPSSEPTLSAEVLPAKQEEEKLLAPKDGILRNGESDETERIVQVVDDGEPEMAHAPLRVYPRRWIVLAVVALLNNTNTISWIGFAPVANHVDSFYNFIGATNYLSVTYMIVTIPVGLFAMWAGRSFGLRWAILIAAFANALGSIIRLGSCFLPTGAMFPVGLIGQAIAAIAYPFIMFLPTKVAGTWFGADQRGLATTIGVMSNPLGVLLANLISPRLVTAPYQVLYLNLFTAIPSVLVCVVAAVAVNRSEPKTPPTLSAATTQMKFLDGLKACLMSPQYLILLFVMGGGIGMFNCLYTVIQQLLCPSGYDNAFSGLCAALMIIGGVFGATAAGIFVDKTKRYTETIKVCMALAVVFGLTFLQLTFVRDIGWLLLLVSLLFGVMGLATYPVGLEMSSECTFPVTETTSTGLIVLCGQIQSVIFIAIMSTLAKPLSPERQAHQVCNKEKPDAARDMTLAVIIISVIAALLVVVLVFFFKPVYKRMNAEKGPTDPLEVNEEDVPNTSQTAQA